MVGFALACQRCIAAALGFGFAVVGCRRGKHRSPVVAATAAMKLRAEGFAVAVVEVFTNHT